MKLLFVILYSICFSLNANELIREKKPKSLIYSDLIQADYRAAFVDEITQISERLKIKPDWLMVCICFETARTFRSNVRNKYSGSVGLIQFIPSTAYRLGTTPGKLAAMNPVEQLYYVEKYFAPYAGKMFSVYDCYIVIFAPYFLGKPESQILYRSDGKTELDRRRYRLNKVLDVNRDGLITIRDVQNQIKKFVPSN